MSDSASAFPPTGRDLLPSTEELYQRLASNLQERQVLEGLLKIIEKDARIRETTRRLRKLRESGRTKSRRPAAD